MLDRSRRRATAHAARVLVESLESRELLSATPQISAVLIPRISAVPTVRMIFESSATIAQIKNVNVQDIGNFQAWVLWDDRRLVKASLVVDSANTLDVKVNNPPDGYRAHGFLVAFWQTNPPTAFKIVKGKPVRSNPVVVSNVLTLGGGLFVDQNSLNTPSVAALQGVEFTAKVANITGPYLDGEILPNSVDGQTSPITYAPDANHTDTLTVLINWGDGVTSAGTLHSDGNGGWSVYGTHTYHIEGPHRIHVTADLAIHTNGSTFGVIPTTLLDVYTTANVEHYIPILTPIFTTPPSVASIQVTDTSPAMETGLHTSATAADIPDATAGTAAAMTLGTVSYAFSSAAANPSAFPVNILQVFYGAQPQGNRISVEVNWGDGTSGLATLAPTDNGAWTIAGSHTYAVAGDYTISVGASVGAAGRPGTFVPMIMVGDNYFSTSIHVAAAS